MQQRNWSDLRHNETSMGACLNARYGAGGGLSAIGAGEVIVDLHLAGTEIHGLTQR